MHIDKATTTIKGKTYNRTLLRETFREKGKVKHRTIANLSKCSEEEIAAFKLVLKQKKDLSKLQSLCDAANAEKGDIQKTGGIKLQQGLSIGAVTLLHSVAKDIGLCDALGNTEEGKLALWQIFARVIDQGSRLSAVRLAESHAACDILGLKGFDEDSLYENLAWLAENQSSIEDKLFKILYPEKKPDLFLYDVTSSYFEGVQNALADFGYNRDGKKGKMQIVIGLLCDKEGRPVSIEVFQGNTSDLTTFSNQIKKVQERFGGASVSFVGDGGMIKKPQIKELSEHDFHYITSIGKAQIRKLIKQDVLQLELFDKNLVEVIEKKEVPISDKEEDVLPEKKTDVSTRIEYTRYIVRCNPQRRVEMEETRQSKLARLEKKVAKENEYLIAHPLGTIARARRDVVAKLKKLKLQKWVSVEANDRTLSLKIDEEAHMEERRLDGCYAIKTNIDPAQLDKETIHGRYKDLASVEKAFRVSKTEVLEMRPIYVRKESSTRAHAFVVMMAYRIVQELAKRWNGVDRKIQESIDELSTLCLHELTLKGEKKISIVPEPREMVATLFKLAGVSIPKVFITKGANVTTKIKLKK